MTITNWSFDFRPLTWAKGQAWREKRREWKVVVNLCKEEKEKEKKDKFIEIQIKVCSQPLQRKETKKRDKTIAVNLNQKEKKDKFIETQFCNAHLSSILEKSKSLSPKHAPNTWVGLPWSLWGGFEPSATFLQSRPTQPPGDVALMGRQLWQQQNLEKRKRIASADQIFDAAPALAPPWLVGFYGERWLANFIWQLHLSWEIIIHQDHLILIRCKARRTGELWATKLSWELRIHQQNILFNTSNWLFLSKLPDQMLCCCRGVLSVHFLESYPCLVSAMI